MTTGPIAQALGDDFNNLHVAVSKHYTEPSIEASCTMGAVRVKGIIRRLVLVSYTLFRGPVPHSGTDVEVSLRNRVDDQGGMHWVRTFFNNASFPETVTFPSRMVCSGDHRVIELTRYGVGVEADLSVDGEGSLVYDMRKYVVTMPFLGLTLRIPTWLSPFGGGRTRETGETEDTFRVEFEMSHPIFGWTVAYAGRCRFKSR